MSDDANYGGDDGDGVSFGRRSLLGTLAAAGLAGCPGDSGDSNTDAPDGGDGDDGGGPPATPSGTPVSVPTGWPETRDPYYGGLARTLGGELGLPAGEFVYANYEAGTMAAFSAGAAAAETSEIDVDESQPFSSAVRVTVTEETENVWDVTMIGTATRSEVNSGDVLLGVVYLRGPEESENEPTVQFVSKDQDNLDTNMVRSTPEVQPSAEWTRYYVPIQFDYDANAGTWRLELFLGYGPQTVDIGGIALIDFGQGVSVDELPSGPASEIGGDGGTDDGDWEAAADERIADHRTSELTVDVTDADGNAVDAADVEVAMREHEFGFGTAVSANHLLAETEPGDPYRENVKDLFNLAVLGNHHKWRFWEENRDLSDGATEWLLDQGLDVRGHVCLWASVSAWAVPPDVVSAMGVEWEDNGVTDPELDPEYVRERTLEHVSDIIEYYGDDIVEWEVVNEVIHEPGLVKAVNGVAGTEDSTLEDPDPVEAPILREWFSEARGAAPEGMPLGINDYNTLTGPYVSTRDQYERQIRYLDDSDSGLDFVGLQCHFDQGSSLTPEQVLEGLDRYAENDVSLRITEFDMSDDGWPEEDKATFFRQFLKATFSHPAVEQFLVWGIYSPIHWRDDAAFFAEGWEEKPALDEYRDLVFDEWWTEESGTTDADGRFTTTGFKGEYEVTAVVDGEDVTETVTLGDDSTTVELSPDA
ncbi:endo-1,4-beta-xylanase [Halosimplex salinum]|uniref:endo-1,4-beta-xylanase n=1 Tax=Halosimplex salinum TaxID=1710538 RepID=UPI000F47F698|nr:endo-1,4-beta-xylanase [Halosimplex salinum]